MRRTLLRQLLRQSPSPIRSSSLCSRLPSPRIAQPPQSASLTSQLQARRGYADTASEKAAAEDQSAPKENEASPANAEMDKLKTELEAKNKEVVDMKDKYLRSVADFRNLQERTKRETAAARDFAISRFARDLVESIDNLDRALGVVPTEAISSPDANKDLKNLYDGLKMTETVLMGTLSKHGLERFDPSEEGQKFDPNLHEAAFMTKMEDKEDGTVFSTMQKGFKLNGRVIRAAKVGVVKNS